MIQKALFTAASAIAMLSASCSGVFSSEKDDDKDTPKQIQEEAESQLSYSFQKLPDSTKATLYLFNLDDIEKSVEFDFEEKDANGILVVDSGRYRISIKYWDAEGQLVAESNSYDPVCKHKEVTLQPGNQDNITITGCKVNQEVPVEPIKVTKEHLEIHDRISFPNNTLYCKNEENEEFYIKDNKVNEMFEVKLYKSFENNRGLEEGQRGITFEYTYDDDNGYFLNYIVEPDSIKFLSVLTQAGEYILAKDCSNVKPQD